MVDLICTKTIVAKTHASQFQHAGQTMPSRQQVTYQHRYHTVRPHAHTAWCCWTDGRPYRL